MVKEVVKTKIQADGLRYKVKEGGSPFASAGDFQAGTMSCFLCGKHRPRNTLKTRRLLGKAQHVCAPSCKEAEAAAAAKLRPSSVANTTASTEPSASGSVTTA